MPEDKDMLASGCCSPTVRCSQTQDARVPGLTPAHSSSHPHALRGTHQDLPTACPCE